MKFLHHILLLVTLLACGDAMAFQEAPEPPAAETETDPAIEELATLQGRYRAQRSTTDVAAREKLLADVKDYCDRHPYELDATLLQARICTALGETERADVLYLDILTADPERIRDGWEWAATHHETNPERTIEILRHLLTLLPERRAYAMALYEYLEKRDPARVDIDFENMLTDQEPSLALLTLVEMVGSQNRDRSTELSGRLLDRYPDNLEALLLHARRLRFANRYADAMNLLNTLEKKLLLRPDVGILYSDCLYMEHQFTPSIEHLLLMEGHEDPDYPQDMRDRETRLAFRTMMIESWKNERAIRAHQAQLGGNPKVRMVVDGEPIVLELYASNAPITVANFLTLAGEGFYDGTPFHHVHVGYISQGGVPPGETYPSWAGPGYSIESETERPDARRHFAGSIAMARITKDKLIGSQFYVTHVPTHNLHGTDPVFGHVSEGLDVVRRMRGGETIDRIEILDPGQVGMNFDVRDADGVSMSRRTWRENKDAVKP